ncbi:MAG TPA: hypothetical protein VIQ00_01440 [Chitinophagaceae bacterium]
MKDNESEILVGAFEKNGLVYHVLITPDINEETSFLPSGRYKGVFLHPLKRNICQFCIEMNEEGQWIPDKKKTIDPWVADNIGQIIQNNL